MIIATNLLYVIISFVLTFVLVQYHIGDNSFEQIFVSAMENEKILSSHEMTNHHNYVQISSQADNNNDRVAKGLCNKLFESCPIQDTESSNDTGDPTTEPDNAADISEKYFEQGSPEIPVSPLTSPQAGQNTTSIIGSVEQPVLLNQSNVTQAEPGFENFTQAENITQAEPGFENFTQAENITQAEPGFEIHENPILGFKILYPSGWDTIENNTERYSVITLVSPQESTSDPVLERLVLRINNFPTNLTLEDYSTRVKDALEKNNNFNIVNFNSTLLSNNSAYGVTGISKEGDQNVNVIDNWTIKDGIVYRIVFYSDDEKSSTYLPIRQKMIDSFSITK